jgi:hypothetical protein
MGFVRRCTIYEITQPGSTGWRCTTTGVKLFFLVQRGETGVVLQFDQMLDFDDSVYFAVP